MEAADIAVRFALYAALLPPFGLAAFSLYAPTAADLLSWRRWLWLPVGLGLVATQASLHTLAARMGGSPASAFDADLLKTVILDTGAGRAWLVRLAALVAAAIFIGKPRALLPLAGVALASLAWNGHAAGGEGTFGWVRLAGDILHLLAAGVWVGALVAFVGLVVARPQGRQITAAALAGFAGIGSGVVAVLVLTGLINTWQSVVWSPLPVLTTGPWGWLLLAKLAAFAGMVGLASANRFWFTPRLAAGEGNTAHLKASLILELTLAVLIVAIVSALGLLPPPASA